MLQESLCDWRDSGADLLSMELLSDVRPVHLSMARGIHSCRLAVRTVIERPTTKALKHCSQQKIVPTARCRVAKYDEGKRQTTSCSSAKYAEGKL